MSCLEDERSLIAFESYWLPTPGTSSPSEGGVSLYHY